MSRDVPPGGPYVIRSVAKPNLVADMAGDKVKDTYLIAYKDHSWEAPNQRWSLSTPWKWNGLNLTTSTRFGEPVIAHVDTDDIEKNRNATIFGTTVHGAAGFPRPWDAASAGNGTVRIFASNCYGFPRFWTLEPIADEPLMMKIALHAREETDLQKWKFDIIH